MLASYRSARRVAGVLVAIATASIVASCVEAPSGPSRLRDDAAANNDLLGLLTVPLSSLNLLSCSTQSYDSVTKVIGDDGGTIVVGQHVFVVPPDALDHNVTITAVTPSVNRREVRFQPEGLQFKKKTTLTMSYAGCSLLSQLLPKKIVYVGDDLSILELIKSVDDILSKKVTGRVEHFSAYAVAY